MLRFAPVLVSASILMSSTAAQSPCECAITNQASVITASQTCHLVGQGPVACFTFVLGSIPGATTPRPGNCEKEATPESPTACSPKRQCEFAPVRLVVTAASCFKDCGGYDGMIPTYTPADFSVMTPPLRSVPVRPSPMMSRRAYPLNAESRMWTSPLTSRTRLARSYSRCGFATTAPSVQLSCRTAEAVP